LQPPLLDKGSDGTQYHFYCDDGKIIGIWAVRFDQFEVHWAWVFDGDTVETFYRQDELSVQVGEGPLHLRNDNFEIATREDGGGYLNIRGANCTLSATFEVRSRVSARSQLGDVALGQEQGLYYPDLDVELTLDNETLRGTGFMKRWIWPTAPEAWHWLFLQGCAEDRSSVIWAADATFGFEKYGYFRLLPNDGDLLETDIALTYHTAEDVRAVAPDGSEYRVAFTPKGEPARAFAKSPDVHAALSMTPVNFVIHHSSGDVNGIGIYEIGHFSFLAGQPH